MKHINVLLLILFASFLLLTIMGMNLVAPPETYAHPQYGFTPQPPPPPPDGGGDDGDSDNDDGGDQTRDDQPPTDYVDVQIERCDLSCSANYATASNGQIFEPIAAIESDDQFLQTLVPINDRVSTVEVLAPIQLIHHGSGWIAEGVVSDSKNTRIAVPYPGQWEVFLVAEPQFVAPETIDPTGLNLEQLKTQLINAPVSLGMVEANTSTTQKIKCPVECVVDLPPPTLPETGSSNTQLSVLLLLAGGSLLGGLGILIYRTHHP